MDEAAELKRFNEIGGRLMIELSEPTERITPQLDNLRAPAAARIVSLRLEPDMFEDDDFRPLRADELAAVVFRRPRVRLRGIGGKIVEHRAPDGRAFTVRDVLAAVEETERQARATSDWFGGVDVHHVHFQGIHPDEEEDDVFEICWGS